MSTVVDQPPVCVAAAQTAELAAEHTAELVDSTVVTELNSASEPPPAAPINAHNTVTDAEIMKLSGMMASNVATPRRNTQNFKKHYVGRSHGYTVEYSMCVQNKRDAPKCQIVNSNTKWHFKSAPE